MPPRVLSPEKRPYTVTLTRAAVAGMVDDIVRDLAVHYHWQRVADRSAAPKNTPMSNT